jgi:hypothetical protein
MATDPNSSISNIHHPDDEYKDINPNRSNDGNSGSPPTNPEIEPGKSPEADPDGLPANPEIEPGNHPPEIDPGTQPDSSDPTIKSNN